MADLLGLAARYIDEGVYEGPGSVNRTTTELSELGDGIALVEAFSHVIALRTSEGLVLFDTSLEVFAAPILTSLRRWSDARIHTIAYTHGHVDHVGGSQAFVEDARARGHAPPRFVGHENVAPRFARYALTNGWNKAINTRQFGRGEWSELPTRRSDRGPGYGPTRAFASACGCRLASSRSSSATRVARPTTICTRGCPSAG